MEEHRRIDCPISPLDSQTPRESMTDNGFSGATSETDENKSPTLSAPALLGIPSKENYHTGTGFVQCVVTRCGRHRYRFAFQLGGGRGKAAGDGGEVVSMIAEKQISSRTSNYRIFDALRGGTNAKLSKKAGHYMGKLRRDKDQPVGCYSLYMANRERDQMAAFVYEIPAIMQQVIEGQPPRKMQAILPKGHLTLSTAGGSSRSRTGGERVDSTQQQGGCALAVDYPAPPAADAAVAPVNRLIEHLHNGTWKHRGLLAVQTRAPRYHEGQYRLNFSGRVLTPSVKNMQLENEKGEALLQFGKVDETRFHLDYKSPFSAFSAFGAALAQFDL